VAEAALEVETDPALRLRLQQFVGQIAVEAAGPPPAAPGR